MSRSQRLSDSNYSSLPRLGWKPPPNSGAIQAWVVVLVEQGVEAPGVDMRRHSLQQAYDRVPQHAQPVTSIAMHFPRPERVIYKHNPLTDVLCQLCFPRLLRVQQELPFEFQERIRSDYPLLEVEEASVSLALAVGDQVQPAASTPLPRCFRFWDSAKVWQVTLHPDFLALSTRQYRRWEEFRDRLDGVLGAFEGVYGWPLLQRVGLRYQDFIRRSTLGLADRPWRSLLAARLGGPLFLDDVPEQALLEHEQVTVFRLDDEIGNLTLRHGLGLDSLSNEPGYSIDCDVHCEFGAGSSTLASSYELRERLRRFNEEAGGVFRWSIGNDLHQALDPQPVADAAP